MLNCVWSLPNTKTRSVGLSQPGLLRRLKKCTSVCVRDRQREREHSPLPVTVDYNVSDLQSSVADPGCFDSERYLSIWDMCLISECWGRRRCEIQINSNSGRSVELQDGWWDAFWGRGKSWNQKIISHCVVKNPPDKMRLKQNIGVVAKLWFFSRSGRESLWKVSSKITHRSLRNSQSGTLIQNPEVLRSDGDSSGVLCGYFHPLSCSDEEQFLTWKMEVFKVPLFFFLLCFTHGLGLSTLWKCVWVQETAVMDGSREGVEKKRKEWKNFF